ncbi:MAG: hypothetical protein GWO19_12710 [Nitrospinaceae bacterium]|nr:hypothetical protein [Nitrospinaceae bacterium]NIS85750.1 hypothetical protein [Nitrospinaceae bacterium]NIW59552.1 hypothetical protein [Nitrospinaceae bacterium]
MTLNPELLKRETQVTQLRQLTELIRAAQEDETRVWQERDQLEEKIQSEMAAFGPDWDETRVRSFQCSEAERKFTQRQANVLANCRQLAGNIKNKLELHREQQVTESSSQSKIPLGIRKFSWLLIGIGFIGAGVALFITDLVLGIFMGLILSAGVGLYIWVSSDKPGRGQEDVLGKMLESKLRKATANQEREIAVWGEWVREKGLDPETTPEGFKEMQAKVLNIQGWLEQKNNLDERLGRMRGKEEEAEQLVAALSEYVDKEDLTGDLPARIEFLCRQFDETKERSVQFRDLEAQLEEQKLRVQGLGEQLQSLRESLDRLLETSGASSEDNFLHQWNLSQKRSTAEKTIREIEKRIQIRVGTGEAFQQFTESMRETQPEQLEQELTCVRSQLNEMHEEHDRINQAIGQARAEADQLASSEDLTRLQNELEAGRERLMNSAREWAAHTLALQLLDKAKHQYEKNRQPQVFQAASRVFSQITGGNYPGVEKPLESDEFRVVQHDGGFKSPVQLSRGTREQLYLSMRFGLIEDYETRAEPLPIVMDDVFVNFDDDRRERVLEILRDFARERQVIILSCHSYLLDTYLKYGAQQVSF